MLKNRKIFIFFVVLLGVVMLFSSSCFATFERGDDMLTVTNYFGQSRTLPAFTDEMNSCKNFLLVLRTNVSSYNGTSEGFYYYNFVGFNSSVDISWVLDTDHGGEDHRLCVSTSDGSDIISFYTNDNSSGGYYLKWTQGSNIGSTHTFSGDCTIVNCSDDLLLYRQGLESRQDFFLKPLNLQVVPAVQGTNLQGVLKEILEILPIVLVIIVGLIGLRKALEFLFRVLRQS